jgi:hypothetical protein
MWGRFTCQLSFTGDSTAWYLTPWLPLSSFASTSSSSFWRLRRKFSWLQKGFRFTSYTFKKRCLYYVLGWKGQAAPLVVGSFTSVHRWLLSYYRAPIPTNSLGVSHASPCSSEHSPIFSPCYLIVVRHPPACHFNLNYSLTLLQFLR